MPPADALIDPAAAAAVQRLLWMARDQLGILTLGFSLRLLTVTRRTGYECPGASVDFESTVADDLEREKEHRASFTQSRLNVGKE